VRPPVSRREWLTGCLALTSGVVAAGAAPTATRAATLSQVTVSNRKIHTVRGPIDAAQLGLTLMHEHVLVDFIGASQVSASRYDADAVFRRALPHLRRVKALGAATLVECTPAYLGRDPRLLNRLAEASGLYILSNTGYYGANQDKHLPPHAFAESAEQLAARWIREWEHGIDDTGIKPAFIKIGVDAGPLSTIDAKLVRAAALAHKATGLPLAAHTGNGVAAFEELDLVEETGVPLSAFIWVHAQSEPDASRRAGRGSNSTGSTRRVWTSTSPSCCRCKPQGAWIACWSRTTQAGITLASPTADGSGPSTPCSRSSCLP
jgi:phosphotriesterase-related protein